MRIGDDSPDPEGYMMLVNASYDSGLFYQQEITGLCENSLFEFTARIINLIRSGGNAIRPNVSFLIDGVAVYSTGNIPENERWNTYGFTFTTQPGQTSVIDNISFRACGPRAAILPFQTSFVCEDSPFIVLDASLTGGQYTNPTYQWQQSFDEGITWSDMPGETSATFTHVNNVGGAYFYRYLLANSLQNLSNSSCRINSNSKTIRVTPKFTSFSDTICDGLSYNFGSNTFNRTGTSVDSLITQAGCDSIVTLNLFVIADKGIESILDIRSPLCVNESNGSIRIDSILDGTSGFRILVDSIELADDMVLQGLAKGEYDLKITDRYGCELDTFFNIFDPEAFDVDISSDNKINLGDSISISTSSNYDITEYQWFNSTLTNCRVDCNPVSVLPINSQWISLNAKSQNKCEATDSLYVEVNNEVKNLFIPNVFTPNSDAYNDFFELKADFPNSIERIETLVIYNRWGQIVYQENELSNDRINKLWDGQFQNKPAITGNYFYKIGIRYLDDEILFYNGQVQILR
jgi:gliding motility-associated-like protein